MNTTAGFPLYLLNQVHSSARGETGELYGSLRKNLQELESIIEEWLVSKEDTPFSVMAERHIELLFSVRIKALKWFAEHEIQTGHLYESTEQSLSRSYDFEREELASLHENVRFALRTVRRILGGASAQSAGGFDLGRMAKDLDPKHTSYRQFKTLLVLSDVPKAFLQEFLHMLRQGLMLELALIAATHVMDHPEQYEEIQITDLSWFIVDASQELGASATQLGIVQRKTGADTPAFRDMSEEEIKQEQQLAEAGFEEWAKNLE